MIIMEFKQIVKWLKDFGTARLNIFGGEVANYLNPVYGDIFIKVVSRVIHIRQNQMHINSHTYVIR